MRGIYGITIGGDYEGNIYGITIGGDYEGNIWYNYRW